MRMHFEIVLQNNLLVVLHPFVRTVKDLALALFIVIIPLLDVLYFCTFVLKVLLLLYEFEYCICFGRVLVFFIEVYYIISNYITFLSLDYCSLEILLSQFEFAIFKLIVSNIVVADAGCFVVIDFREHVA
jgi:hypothetical protein